MKIEIVYTDNINEKCTGMTCFTAEAFVSKKIHSFKGDLKGVIIIDGEPSKFSFSPFSLDGDIFTDNEEHRLIIKSLLPILAYNQMRE